MARLARVVGAPGKAARPQTRKGQTGPETQIRHLPVGELSIVSTEFESGIRIKYCVPGICPEFAKFGQCPSALKWRQKADA
jgi:hypothetical protein